MHVSGTIKKAEHRRIDAFELWCWRSAGVQPRWIQRIRSWGRSWRPGKNLFNYRYRGRLETDSVVGELVEKRGWTTGLHGISITTYVGHRHLSILPKERKALRPPRSNLRSPGRISRLGEYPHFRWEFSQESGEQERNDTGESVFPETDPISLFFRFVYIPFCYT